MREKEWRLALLVALSLSLLLSACNFDTDQAAQLIDQLQPTQEEPLDLASPDIEDPVFSSVEPSELILKGLQCQPNGIQFNAALLPDESGISSVSMRYRLQGDFPNQESDWMEVPMADQGVVNDEVIFMADFPDLGAQAMELFDDGWGVLEYQLEAEDGAGNVSAWPGDEPVAEMGVAPCPLASELTILDGSLEPQSAEYGQGPGCEPSIVTFGLTLENAESLDEAWVSARWYVGDYQGDYQPASDPMQLPMLPAGPSGEYPGSVVFGVNVDIQDGGQTYLQGQDGFLAWRMRAKDLDGNVGEWPMGDAPPVFITACSGDFAPNPTATQGAILVLPTATPTPGLGILVLPTPTPTQGLVLVPGELLHASGRNVVIYHEQAFDFDNGQIVNPASPQADFVLTGGDDPYLDDMEPLNGSYVGWYGDEAPSKSDCNILKATFPMPVDWPDKADSYYCFDTSDGRVAWLQLDTYVSQPFNERRMIFHFKTFQ